MLQLDPIDVMLLPTVLQPPSERPHSIHGLDVQWTEDAAQLAADLAEGQPAARFGASLLRPTRKVQLGAVAADGTSAVLNLLGTDDLLVSGRAGDDGGVIIVAASSLDGSADILQEQLVGDWIERAPAECRPTEAWWTTASLDGHRVTGATTCAFSLIRDTDETEVVLKNADPQAALPDDVASWLREIAAAATTNATPPPRLLREVAADPVLSPHYDTIRANTSVGLLLTSSEFASTLLSGPAGTARFDVDADADDMACSISNRGLVGELVETLYALAEFGTAFTLTGDFGGRSAKWTVSEESGDWLLSDADGVRRRGKTVDELVGAVAQAVAHELTARLPTI